MKLYLLQQSDNRGYDTYDSCVVCAENEEEAVLINPCSGGFNSSWSEWASSPDKVSCTEIGTANDSQKKGIILASFNAG